MSGDLRGGERDEQGMEGKALWRGVVMSGEAARNASPVPSPHVSLPVWIITC